MKLSIRKFLLSLTLLVPALQQTACADEVTYLYRSWDESTKTVKTETKTVNATPLRSVAKDGEWMGLGDGWYYMEGERINIKTLNILTARKVVLLRLLWMASPLMATSSPTPLASIPLR